MKILTFNKFFEVKRYKSDLDNKISKVSAVNFLKDCHPEILKNFISWENIYKSPIGSSFYSKIKRKNFTEDGTLRLSDHWNYTSRRDGKIHAKTNTPVINSIYWTIGKWSSETNSFDVILTHPKGEYDTKDLISSTKSSQENLDFIEFQKRKSKIISDLCNERRLKMPVNGKEYDIKKFDNTTKGFRVWDNPTDSEFISSHDESGRNFVKNRLKLKFDNVEFTKDEFHNFIDELAK